MQTPGIPRLYYKCLLLTANPGWDRMADTEPVKFSGSALASSLDLMGLGHVCIYPKNPGSTKVLSPGYAGKKV